MNCEKCGAIIEKDFNFCGNCGLPLSAKHRKMPNKVCVTVDVFGNINIAACNLAECKAALKELKLLKREMANKKRLIMEHKRQIRANYTHVVRKPNSWWDGKITRSINRQKLAENLLPYEQEQQNIENFLIRVHRAIIDVEGWIIQYS